MMENTIKSRVPIMHEGKQSNFVFLSCMMGRTVKSRVPIMHDGKQSNVVFL